MNGYVCMWRGKRVEVHADTSYAAHLKAATELRVPRGKQYEITVVLCEKDGKPVTHGTEEL